MNSSLFFFFFLVVIFVVLTQILEADEKSHFSGLDSMGKILGQGSTGRVWVGLSHITKGT